MSCSPCTIIISWSWGTTSNTARPTASHVGTTPNTGGAYLPDVYASLSSLVAAAYCLARSGSSWAVRSSYVVPSLSTGSAMGTKSRACSSEQARLARPGAGEAGQERTDQMRDSEAVTVTRLLLVRHAQSEWNATGRWQGAADPPLSELG